ncbi:MAG: LemA family protein [Mariniphaga sp.]
MKRGLLIIWVAMAGLFLSGCGYNKMVDLEEQVASQWSQVENVYQRRADLIPNLVNTVKGYAEHEQETLTGVIEARSKATSVNIDPNNLTPEAIEQFNQAQEGLSSALSRLMVVVERYPDLKANQNFLDLQAQLEGTENRIAVERRKFNEVTQSYNSYIRKFPQLIYAGMLGFDKKNYFEARQGADQPPVVEF